MCHTIDNATRTIQLRRYPGFHLCTGALPASSLVNNLNDCMIVLFPNSFHLMVLAIIYESFLSDFITLMLFQRVFFFFTSF